MLVSGRLLVADLDGLSELSVDVGREEAVVQNVLPVEVPGLAQAPSYSPDGKFFAYVSPANGTADIMVGSIDGADAFSVTGSPLVSETGPAWSPDGKLLAYERTDETGSTTIWLADIKSGEQRQVTYGNDVFLSPDWAPGSSRFAYVARSRETGTSDLFAYDTSTDTTTQLTATAGVSESQPDYAPDGKRLVYTVAQNASDAGDPKLESTPGDDQALGNSIYVLDPDAEPKRVPEAAGNFLFLDWLSDDTLSVVEFSSPGHILAMPLSDPDRASVIWDGKGLASFDWRTGK